MMDRSRQAALILVVLGVGLTFLACGTAAPQEKPGNLPVQALAPQVDPTFTPAPTATREPQQTIQPTSPDPTTPPSPVIPAQPVAAEPTPPTSTPTATHTPTSIPTPILEPTALLLPTAKLEPVPTTVFPVAPTPTPVLVAAPTPTAPPPTTVPTPYPTVCVQGADTPSGEVCYEDRPTPTLKYPSLGYNYNKDVVKVEEALAAAEAAGLDPSTVEVGNQFVYVRFESASHRESATDWLESRGLKFIGWLDSEKSNRPVGIIHTDSDYILMVIPTTWLVPVSELNGFVGIWNGCGVLLPCRSE